ncbi:MAG: hypothetical protein JOY66_25795 [Acetobacteraceae bacterium]|nr:hypothetical protein [Acetobacteraceae bacterium]
MLKPMILSAFAAGLLAMSAAGAGAAPVLHPAMWQTVAPAALTRVDWDHCDWRCREWRHRRWEHERWEARQRWEHRHDDPYRWR